MNIVSASDMPSHLSLQMATRLRGFSTYLEDLSSEFVFLRSRRSIISIYQSDREATALSSPVVGILTELYTGAWFCCVTYGLGRLLIGTPQLLALSTRSPPDAIPRTRMLAVSMASGSMVQRTGRSTWPSSRRSLLRSTGITAHGCPACRLYRRHQHSRLPTTYSPWVGGQRHVTLGGSRSSRPALSRAAVTAALAKVLPHLLCMKA